MTSEEIELRKRELTFQAWKTIVEVQMHFNDMMMRIRGIATTLIVAAFGAAAYLLQQKVFLRVGPWRVHVSLIIIVLSLAGWFALGLMDWGHYYRLLIGAVRKSTEIEEMYRGDPIFGMTRMITEESRRFWGKREFKARHKILLFYLIVLGVGSLFAFLLLHFSAQPSS